MLLLWSRGVSLLLSRGQVEAGVDGRLVSLASEAAVVRGVSCRGVLDLHWSVVLLVSFCGEARRRRRPSRVQRFLSQMLKRARESSPPLRPLPRLRLFIPLRLGPPSATAMVSTSSASGPAPIPFQRGAPSETMTKKQFSLPHPIVT